MLSLFLKSRLSHFLIYGLLISQAAAYPFDDSLDEVPQNFSQSGNGGRIDGPIYTYNIPITNWPEGLVFSTVQGGDGNLCE